MKSHSLVKLSVVIVNFNAGDFLIRCLDSIVRAKEEADFEVWIIDNGSTDKSLEKAKKSRPDLKDNGSKSNPFLKVRYIENGQNLGFGAANNKALGEIKNEMILFLNPDTELKKGTIEYMLSFMSKHPQVGAATCKALHSDGSIDWAYHRGFPTPLASLLYFLGWDRLYHLTSRDMDSPHEVDAISGSFFMTRKSVLDRVGIFDEDFWLYGEDLDLCFRIKEAGFKIMYVPQVTITHLKGVSSGIKEHSQKVATATSESRIKAFNSFYETMKIFYHKHLAYKYPFFINWIVYLGIDIKWLLAKRKLRV